MGAVVIGFEAEFPRILLFIDQDIVKPVTHRERIFPDNAVFVEVSVGESVAQIEFEAFVSQFNVGLESFGLEVTPMVDEPVERTRQGIQNDGSIDPGVEKKLVDAETDFSESCAIVDIPVGAIGTFEAVAVWRNRQYALVLDALGFFCEDGWSLVAKAADDAGSEPGVKFEQY